MAYPVNHHLLSFGGTLPGSETWTMGLRLSGVPSGVGAAAEAVKEGYATGLGTAWAAQVISSLSAPMTWMKLNEIGTNGKYVSATTLLHDYATPVAPGTSCGHRWPNQATVVVSLQTGRSRGLGHAGRLYFPHPAQDIDIDGRFSVAIAATMTGSAVDFIDAINAVGDGFVVIGSKVREGAFQYVRKVAVGRVMDTMRSRRTSLLEDRVPQDVIDVGFTGGGGAF